MARSFASTERDESAFAEPHSNTERLDLANTPAYRSRWWKRPLDLTLIVLLAPLWVPTMLLAALWIRCTSPGPVIYRQERVGFRQRRFTIYKFRSMKVCAESAAHENHVADLIKAQLPMTKLDRVGDKRLIPMGAFLRALGLDELPQIFNVLDGDMSLVGPRPCTPYELKHYSADDLVRLETPPGLTGYWQVNGKNDTTFNEMIELDRFYARNASLRLDLQILAKTAPAVVAQLSYSVRSPRMHKLTILNARNLLTTSQTTRSSSR